MKNILSKLLSGFIISSLATLANAQSYNEWNRIFQWGILELEIVNNKQQSFLVDCNISATPEKEHLVSYYNPNNESLSVQSGDDDYKSFSLNFDGENQPFPSPKTRTTIDAIAWKKFTISLSKANKIEVVKNKEIIATFFPTFKSMENIREIKSCSPMREWNK